MKIILAAFILLQIITISIQVKTQQRHNSKTSIIDNCEASNEECVVCEEFDQQNRTLFLTHDHKCVTSCPLDSFPDQATRKCLKIQHEQKMTENLLKCENNSFFLNDKTCTCPQCNKCPEPFLCPRPNICRNAEDCCCPADYNYYETKENGNTYRHCVKECPIGYCNVGNICVHTDEMRCPAGYFLDVTNPPQCCRPCKDPCCKKCGIDGECIQCAENGILDQDVSFSVTFTYTDSCQLRTQTISAIQFQNCQCCKIAQNGTTSQCHCDYCENDKCHANNKQCSTCPDGYYESSPTRCDKCHDTCSRCFGSKENQCIVCHPNQKDQNSRGWLKGTTCVSDCGSKHFKTQDNCGCMKIKQCDCKYNGPYPEQHLLTQLAILGIENNYFFHYCESCHDNCLECTGPGPDECTKCPSGYILINNQNCIPESAFQQKTS